MAKVKPITKSDLEIMNSRLLKENGALEDRIKKLTQTILEKNQLIGEYRKQLNNKGFWRKLISLLGI